MKQWASREIIRKNKGNEVVVQVYSSEGRMEIKCQADLNLPPLISCNDSDDL